MATSVSRMLWKTSLAFRNAMPLVKDKLCPLYSMTQAAYMSSQKHYDPRFRERRRNKQLLWDLKESQREEEKEDESKLSLIERRQKNKERNPDIPPKRTFRVRRPLNLESGEVLDNYIPPEGDGKHTLLKKEGLLELKTKIQKKAAARIRAIRRMRKHGEENFNLRDVVHDLMDVYIEAQTLLQDYKKNKRRLHELTTLKGFAEMTFNLDRATLKWEFVENIEPPRVVHVACEEVFLKDNYIAQVTVRFHSRQKLAMYDQFGRLALGNPDSVIDVLDFVVFEKNIVDLYGRWKIMSKIQPPWMPRVFKHASCRLGKVQGEEDFEEVNELDEKEDTTDAATSSSQ